MADIVSEFTLLEQLLRDVPQQAEGLLFGVGDDCAVLAANGMRDWVISTDQSVEGIHFTPQWADWRAIGYRAAAAAISDIAAMGGRPRYLLIGLSVPKSLSVAAITDCFAGMRDRAAEDQMLVIGGDTTGSRGGVLLAVTAIGEVGRGRAVYRRGARSGDLVYVTGTLGGSGAGLYALAHQIQNAGALVARHIRPPNRIAAGQWLASTGCVTSMIDISDGLLQDAGHIAGVNRVQVQIEAVRVPMYSGVSHFAHDVGVDPLQMTVGSGEEYELLFTVAGARGAAFRQLVAGAERSLGHALSPIGIIVPGTGVTLLSPAGEPLPIEPSGYAHEFGSEAV